MKEEYKKIISGYVEAKDENKPHLMEYVFAKSATLKIKSKAANISFPSKVAGLVGITEVLVNHFNDTYEDVTTICLSDTVDEKNNQLSCRWLVGMTERLSGSSRVGCGEYLWRFEGNELLRADHLTIVIDHMAILSGGNQTDVMHWLKNLPYPWAFTNDVLSTMPDLPLLSEIRSNIA